MFIIQKGLAFWLYNSFFSL